MNIFISYNHSDQISALRIKKMIENELNTKDTNANYKVWMDNNDLGFGKVIDKEIEDALVKADWMLLLWSKSAALSQGIKHELEVANENNIKILPCLLDKTPLPEQMGAFGLLGIDFSNFTVGAIKLKSILLAANNNGFNKNEERVREHTEMLNLMSHFNNNVKRGSLNFEEEIFMIKNVVLAQYFNGNLNNENPEVDDLYKDYIDYIVNTIGKRHLEIENVKKIESNFREK